MDNGITEEFGSAYPRRQPSAASTNLYVWLLKEVRERVNVTTNNRRPQIPAADEGYNPKENPPASILLTNPGSDHFKFYPVNPCRGERGERLASLIPNSRKFWSMFLLPATG